MFDTIERVMKTTAIIMSALAAIPSFAIEIPVEVPSRGYVSLQIFDSNGEVVGHAISQEPLEKGSRTVDWDMRDTIDGNKLGTGEYTYRAVRLPRDSEARFAQAGDARGVQVLH